MYCRITITFVVALMFCSLIVGQDRTSIINQKDELHQIQTDLEQGKIRLDSLKTEELSIQTRVSDYDQRISSNRKIISRLNRQLGGIRQDIDGTETQMLNDQQRYDRSQRRYLGNIRQFYLASRQPGLAISHHPNKEIELNRQAAYLRALSGFESDLVAQASHLLDSTTTHLDQLTGERTRMTSLKQKRETASSLDRRRKEHQEKELATVHRQKSAEVDRVMMLSQAAQEMEAIIARLEQSSQESPSTLTQVPVVPSIMASVKGNLKAPCRGKIITVFGTSVDPITNLKSYSPGITIQSKASRQVKAIAAGRVVYVGQLRGYGNFTIIDHGDQYYSTYAGLSEVLVKKGRMVHTGMILANAAADGKVRFELRRGREALDPVKWIKIDSF